MEPTVGQSCHHMTAQTSPTTLGFCVVTAEFLPGNPQAKVVLVHNAEKRIYLKIHLLFQLLIQIFCILLQKEWRNPDEGGDPYP